MYRHDPSLDPHNIGCVRKMKITYTIYLLCLISPLIAVDFYELLGVTRDASKATIRKAFKKIALVKHPDKNKVSHCLKIAL